MQLERQLIARLKTANIRFTDPQVERIWAIVSAHHAGLAGLILVIKDVALLK